MFEQPKTEQKANPAPPQYVISLTQEQYDARLGQAAVKEAPPRSPMEMGGSGTATASFTDAAGGAVAVTAAEWSSTGPITVEPDETNSMSAKLTPTGLGPATITATVQTANGSTQAHAEVVVIEKVGAPVSGAIAITVQPPAPPVEPPPVA